MRYCIGRDGVCSLHVLCFARSVSAKSCTRPFYAFSVRSGLDCLGFSHGILNSDTVLALRVSSVTPLRVPLHYPPRLFLPYNFYITPRLRFGSRNFFFLLRSSLPGTFSCPIAHCSSSFSSCPSNASDTASSSFAPRYQRPGSPGLFFFGFAYSNAPPVGFDSLLSDQPCTCLSGYYLAS